MALKTSKPNDHMYIHYSSHGSCRAMDGAVALELVNPLALVNEYLYGTRHGAKVSDKILHQHLRAQFPCRLPDQTPMLYDHRRFALFGDFVDNTSHTSISTVSMHRSMEDGCLILHAGQADGVHRNDEYALTPFDRSTNLNHRASIRCRVYEVECLSSKIETLDQKNEAGIVRGSTWEAILLASLSRRKIQICLDLEKSVCAALVQAESATSYLKLCHKSSTDSKIAPLAYVVKKTLKDCEISDLTAEQTYVVAKVLYDPKENTGALFDVLDHISGTSSLRASRTGCQVLSWKDHSLYNAQNVSKSRQVFSHQTWVNSEHNDE
ncbi:uncharacterized protein FMAN_07128 [Fusarium mangiferae]|uniref:Uncharacterized protein n=1 Tax=Fusarium mangiferae TaxID=192010 RepID=A0A1L7TA45_FUSMA|nr:uncharacterized protein FMAN_07128 [Fusarium mangiferae]CVK92171.1 uncharacterized protein FMAN_07128 [Fusarium mangiferae]